MCTFAGVVAGIQAGAQIASGLAANKAAKQEARQVELQARADEQAALAEAERIREQNRRRQGSMRAAFGARGVDAGSASAVETLAAAAGEKEFPALAREYEGASARHQAGLRAARIRAEARNALNRSILGAAGDFMPARANPLTIRVPWM